MKSKFYCNSCQYIFESDGSKLEYQDPFYGPCWKRVAKCPKCNIDCDEYWKKPSTSNSKNEADFDNLVSNLRNRGSGCFPGGGCCG